MIQLDLVNQQELELKDQFLDTACRVKMNNSQGIISYLDFLDTENGQMPTDTDEIPQLALSVMSKFVESETYNVKAQLNASLQQDLQKYHGIDATATVMSTLYAETLVTTQNRLYKKYKELGDRHMVSQRTKWQSFLNKWFKIEFPVYSNDAARTVIMFANRIATESRRGPANFCIVSQVTLCELETSNLFVYDQHNTLYNTGTIRRIGSIGNIAVYVNPNLDWKSDQIVIGRSTTDREPGVYFPEYSREIVEHTNAAMATEITMISRNCIVDAGSASKNYWTCNLIIDKKPFWRLIIGA